MRDDLLQAMLEQARDHALILIDAHGIIVEWLAASARVFGYSDAEIRGQSMDVLFTEGDRTHGVPHAEREIARRFGRAEDDRWMRRNDGSTFWATGVLTCLRNAAGEVVGFGKVLRDRTDLRGQVETLVQRLQHQTQESQRKDLLLGTLAHELRSPLATITNAAAVIDKLCGEDEALREASALIGRQTAYMAKLVEDQLNAARARAGQAPPPFKNVDLQRLIDDAIEAASAAIHERQLSIEALIAPPRITIAGDATRLKQVFVNLLTNAAKFSAPRGKIRVEGFTEPGEAVVRVVDEGHGISAAFLPRIFDLFAHGEGAHGQDGGGGLGLGLSIVKEHVELHGGSVQVRSEGVGRGSEFIVRLPLASHAGASAQQTPRG